MIATLLHYGPDLTRRDTANHFLPIDMLQLSIYEYSDISDIHEDRKRDFEKIRDLLIKHGSPDISFAPLTVANFGNFLVVHFKAIYSVIPGTEMHTLNQGRYFTMYNNGIQDILLGSGTDKRLDMITYRISDIHQLITIRLDNQ